MHRAGILSLVLLCLVLPACRSSEPVGGPVRSQPVASQPVASQPVASQPAGPLDFREVIRSAKAKVFPTVVFIKVLQQSHESGKKTTNEVAGSGVIISPAGEVLTNWHVVDKAVEVRCLLYDGRAMQAKVLGSDQDTDLALLKLELPAETAPIPSAELGDSSELREGDFVMAMGAPWGLSRSVSMGIISCTRRYLPEQSQYSLWLQTDAAISPGNSGGPLVNTDGQIIGINARGVLIGGDMGFAVPSETVRLVVSQLREFGKVNWSWMGMQLQPLRDFDRNIYFDGDEGVIIAETDPDSPARRAGIQARDRILKVGGQPLNAVTAEDLPVVRRQLGLLSKLQSVEIEILRGNEPVRITLIPREKGKVEGDELDLPRWDFTAKTINQFANKDLYFHRQQGVFVYGVKYPGNAANLSTNDIILRIDGKEVTTLEDVKAIHKAALDNIGQQHRIVFTILRNGLMRQVVLDFSRDYQED
jgi:serine protease Do